jgi:hypothetical protein
VEGILIHLVRLSILRSCDDESRDEVSAWFSEFIIQYN